jgi:hypothetical protein
MHGLTRMGAAWGWGCFLLGGLGGCGDAPKSSPAIGGTQSSAGGRPASRGGATALGGTAAGASHTGSAASTLGGTAPLAGAASSTVGGSATSGTGAGNATAASGGAPGTGGGTAGTAAISARGGTVGTGASSARGGTTSAGGSPSTGGTTSTRGGSGGGFSPGGQSTSGKLDVLFVIDNSLSMGDKQELLIRPVPELVERLVNPRCVDTSGRPLATPASPTAPCTAGSREFAPVTDLHVGVITSALGAAGKTCAPGGTATPRDSDRGELIAPLRGAPHDGQGFLGYDGTQDLSTFLGQVAANVQAAGEQGCGYESTQEAWYRFLVDPEPPSAMVFDGSVTVAQGTNTTLLAQRAAFLRPDSGVVIVLLSDENDCSMIDYGLGWLVANEGRLPRSVSKCAENPNDRCCFDCRQSTIPTGCPLPAQDPECQKDMGEGFGAGALASYEDAANLRCWQQKRRFGFDLLFPIQRYVDGLTNTTVMNRSGLGVPNPLFAGGRHPSLVTLVGIVGVPWQDLATDATLGTPGELELMSYQELSARGRFDLAIGSPDASPPVSPTDPFMLESVDPRSGANPVTGQPVVASDSTDPLATINGHEVFTGQNSFRDDLQYACIFPLVTPRDCTQPEYTTTDFALRKGCDCGERFMGRNRPLCQPPQGGADGTTQYFAKAYPGTRHLRVLQGLGPRGVVGSICPRNTSDPASQDYGYGPVVQALMTRLRQVLQ